MTLGLALLATAELAQATVLSGTHTWSGVVRLEEDVYVPPGSTLVVLPGTRVVFAPAPGTKTDPVFWNGDTELAVAGSLTVRGTPDAPVIFEGEGQGSWGGLVAAPGGYVALERVIVRRAQEALLAVDAGCVLRAVRFEGVDHGLVLGPGARMDLEGLRVDGCRVGVLDLRDSSASRLTGVEVTGASDAAGLGAGGPPRQAEATGTRSGGSTRTELVGEYTVEHSERWSGDVIVSGRVTVVPGAVLTLEAGTRVAFRKVDSDGDGLGEGELLVLGGIRSLGTAPAPVVFESAEAAPRAGDWDKVSLIASEDPDNRFRFTVFRHGVQALHAHFSRFVGEDCYFEGNLRAVQFQESDGAQLVRCVFRANKQALRFRDSRASVTGCRFLNNLYAVHAFRCALEFADNTLEGNVLGGFFAKESQVVFRGNRLSGNRDGARLKDPGSRAEIRGNRFESSVEDALSLSQVDGVVEGNRFDGAGLDLVGVEDSGVVLRGNDFERAGRDALHLKGATDVAAPANFWGTGEPAARIHDRQDDPGLGGVVWAPALAGPPPLTLPLSDW